MTDVEMTDNVAAGREVGGSGGGGRLQNAFSEFVRVLFRNNTAATATGGGMAVSSDGVINMTSCSFIDNRAYSHGGAFSSDGQGIDFHVVSTIMDSNSALAGEGGGMIEIFSLFHFF